MQPQLQAQPYICILHAIKRTYKCITNGLQACYIYIYTYRTWVEQGKLQLARSWLSLLAPNVMATPRHVPRAAPAVVLRPRYRMVVVDGRPLRRLHHTVRQRRLLHWRRARSDGAEGVGHDHCEDEKREKLHGEREKLGDLGRRMKSMWNDTLEIGRGNKP